MYGQGAECTSLVLALGFCCVEMILKEADLSDGSDELDSCVKSVLQYYIHKSCSLFLYVPNTVPLMLP